jgi:hypothetical protein
MGFIFQGILVVGTGWWKKGEKPFINVLAQLQWPVATYGQHTAGEM